MNLRFSSFHKSKNETNLHYLIHATLPTCICALFLLLLFTAITLNPYSIIYQTTIESNPNQFVMGVPQTKEVTRDILLYLWIGQPIKTQLSSQAITHMADVRALFIVGEIALLILALATYFLQKNKTKAEKLSLLAWSSSSSLATIFFTTLLSFFGFEKIFLKFHEIVFNNSLWLFPKTDTLIMYFPQYFFQTVATRTIFCVALALVIVLLLSKLIERQQRLSSSKPAQHI